MLDEILGRPSPSVRRTQIFLVLFFWVWRLYKGDGARALPDPLSSFTSAAAGPRRSPRSSAATARALTSSGMSTVNSLQMSAKRRAWWRRLLLFFIGRKSGMTWMWRVNDRLKHFTPYQLILGTLTLVYALRHFDDLLGTGAPEPLSSMYTRSYYRATYINTAFDAGFASAMAIRPKWLKDLCSIAFAGYYLVWATEGDEVLRRFRAICSVEMLRTTWEKTNNPYVRLLTVLHRPRIPVVRTVTIPRPGSSSRSSLPPVKAMLFFAGPEADLARATELVVDFPGGGFIAMGPECHEERLRRWAKRTGKPVLGIDYGKAPEYPYPWAIEEGFDAYRTLMETNGTCIGIKSGRLAIVLTGDSAGGNICTTIMNRILEHPTPIPRPVSIILAYPALDFNFTSWMSPQNLRVLQTEQSETHIPGLMHVKDHMGHRAPLSVVDDIGGKRPSHRRLANNRTRKSWIASGSISKIGGMTMTPVDEKSPPTTGTKNSPQSPSIPMWTRALPRTLSTRLNGWLASEEPTDSSAAEDGVSEPSDDSEDDIVPVGPDRRRDADKSLQERVKTPGVDDDISMSNGILVSSPKILTPRDSTSNGDEVHDVGAAETGAAASTAATAETPKRKKKAPIGTRLTMTSRVGYFQDRIISPSMMRAMAILYIGPRRSPDFETDYYISPLLSPPHLLAYFPPVYLICGERDPFVDDTVIFAGKIREAKRWRRAQAASTSGASAGFKFGEGLRMSTGAGSNSTAPNGSTLPDHILRETDDDWVQMRIIEGWGHGFMQMSAIMREVDSVLIEMADWIDESFERRVLLEKDQDDVAAAHAAARAAFSPDAPILLSPEESLLPPPPRNRHVKPAREYKLNPPNMPLGESDLGAALGSDGDEDGMLTFTPKTKRRGPPPTRFTPVPRRSSKDGLNDLHRTTSAPKFDMDDTTSSGETVNDVQTPPSPTVAPSQPIGPSKGSGAFAFFSRTPASSAPTPRAIPGLSGSSPATALYASAPASRRGGATPTPLSANAATANPLVAAAVASAARAASPALAAAGLVPQHLGRLTEAELMRRRRVEAVFGMGETNSAAQSDEEE